MPGVLDAITVLLELVPPALDAARPEHYEIQHQIGAGGNAKVLLGVVGGGGEVIEAWFPVEPGQTLKYSIGEAGRGRKPSEDGEAGGDSIFEIFTLRVSASRVWSREADMAALRDDQRGDQSVKETLRQD